MGYIPSDLPERLDLHELLIGIFGDRPIRPQPYGGLMRDTDLARLRHSYGDPGLPGSHPRLRLTPRPYRLPDGRLVRIASDVEREIYTLADGRRVLARRQHKKGVVERPRRLISHHPATPWD
jgi:hypothetical protein